MNSNFFHFLLWIISLSLTIICIVMLSVDLIDEHERQRNIQAIKAMAADKRLKDCVVRDQDMVCTYSLAGVRRSKVVEY